MINTYDPDTPKELTSWLGTYVGAYGNDFLDYWELQNASNPQFSPEEIEYHRKLNSIGEAITHVLHTLAPDQTTTSRIRELFEGIEVVDGWTPEFVAKVAKILHSTHIVRDAVSINLASDAVSVMLPTAETRAPDLVALFSGRELSQRAAAYLDRVTRLYLWGFDPECVLMCRSVLEAALTSKLHPDADPDSRSPNLWSLLQEAARSGILPEMVGKEVVPESPLWKADAIRHIANQVVHAVPVLGSSERGEIGDSRQAVVYLCDVLSVLFPGSSQH